MALVYHYHFQGLILKSAFPFPELAVADSEKHDLVVSEGLASGFMPDEQIVSSVSLIHGCLHMSTGPDGTLVFIEGMGHIWIGLSGEIVLERLPGVRLGDGRIYILGTALGIFLLQRGAFPLHGSTVSRNGRSLMFIGPSGAGKSTLSAYWMNRGYTLVTDDVSLVQYREDGVPAIRPALPHIKLWEDSALALNHNPDTLPFLSKGWEKRRLPIPAEGMAIEETVLDAIIELSPEAFSSPKIELLNGVQRFNAIAANIYRGEAIPWLGQVANHFVFSSRLAAAVPIFRLTRPANAFALDELYELVEQALRAYSGFSD